MSESGNVYVINVQGAKYADWERSRVVLTDGKGNETGHVVAPEYPGVLEYVARGGEIQLHGTPADELAYWKRKKVEEIGRYADRRLEENEPEYSRRARLARIACVSVFPQGGPIAVREIDKSRFDAGTLDCAGNYIRHVLDMRTVDAVRAFEPGSMAWPKHT